MGNISLALQKQPWGGENSRIVYQTMRDFFRLQAKNQTDNSAPLHYCIALSGGPDSLALLAGAAYYRKFGDIPVELSALIINHNLQSRASAMAVHAQREAARLNIAARIIEVEVKSHSGLEADARYARYSALLSNLSGATLLLGHTLDDQAETLLLALVRGSGANALSGMSVHPDLDQLAALPSIDPDFMIDSVSQDNSVNPQYKVFRPLLSVRRKNTWQACHEWELQAVFDEHNGDPKFLRSKLRNQVMPLLAAELGSHLAVNLAKSAEMVRADNLALMHIAQQKYHEAYDISGGLSSTVLLSEFPAIRNRIIHYWLAQQGILVQRRQIEAMNDLLECPGFSARIAVPNPPGVSRDMRTIVRKCKINDKIILLCTVSESS